MEQTTNDFFRHLHDTVILLGLERYFADLLNNPDAITEADVEALRKYNGKLVDITKSKLVNINKITVSVQE